MRPERGTRKDCWVGGREKVGRIKKKCPGTTDDKRLMSATAYVMMVGRSRGWGDASAG